MRLSFDDEESFTEAVGSFRFNNNPSNDLRSSSCSSMAPPERNDSEDICLNNLPSDPLANTLWRVPVESSTSSTLPQESGDGS